MILFFLLLSVALLSALMTNWLRRYALSRNLLDIPSERSSHTVPTPRGGGLAIVTSFILALPVLYGAGWLDGGVVVALVGAGISMAGLGFLDDHGHIAARWRLLGHFIAAAWVLFWLGGLPPVTLLGGVASEFGWVGQLVAAFYLVWLLNLYNFMDGIDGIAGAETMTVCVGAALLYVLAGLEGSAVPLWVLVMAVGGFLVWNYPPARIFMGDAGSGALGILLGTLSLHAAWQEPALLWGWLILLGVFIVDATFTLCRRLLRGDKVYQAHRSHAYQCAAREFESHKVVTLAVSAINLLWLLPCAALVVSGYVEGLYGLLGAYLPLLGLAIRFRAGQQEAVKP